MCSWPTAVGRDCVAVRANVQCIPPCAGAARLCPNDRNTISQIADAIYSIGRPKRGRCFRCPFHSAYRGVGDGSLGFDIHIARRRAAARDVRFIMQQRSVATGRRVFASQIGGWTYRTYLYNNHVIMCTCAALRPTSTRFSRPSPPPTAVACACACLLFAEITHHSHNNHIKA